VALHPSQTLEIDRPYEIVLEQCIRGINGVLGGVVRFRDDAAGVIEATFGLVDSERLSVSLTRLRDGRTRVVIESRRGARPEPTTSSPYVRALAEYLQAALRSDSP